VKRLPLILLLFLLPALACNFPETTTVPEPNQATLQAQLFPATPGEGEANPPQNSQPGGGEPSPTPFQPAPGEATPVPAQPGGPIAYNELLAPGDAPVAYRTQPGDTLPALAKRFGVNPEEISLPDGLSTQGLLPASVALTIPAKEAWTLRSTPLLPDSEVVYGPSAADFNIQEYIAHANGFLAGYSETVDGETLSGPEIVRRISLETSTDPRLLLAVLEYRAGWVFGQPRGGTDYPIGFMANNYSGLDKELTLVARELTIGYYGVRGGWLGAVDFPHDVVGRASPLVNAGTAALQVLFARLYSPEEWAAVLYGADGFPAFYAKMFGDPWARSRAFEPVLPDGIGDNQPDWRLPFPKGERWAFTGGPHLDWGTGDPLGALDFAPTGEVKGCNTSSHWATAVADGVVARSERGQLLLDLDGDGDEHTGWELLYLHLADQDRLPAGTQVIAGDRLGHPSCEGGVATGKHVHIARKYNGEWIGLDGAFPWVMSGWQAIPGTAAYQGTLTRDGQTVTAKGNGSAESQLEW
jgi:LysM repeat protein